MGMSAFYGGADERESIATIHRALELRCNFLDTSDMYGPIAEALPPAAGERYDEAGMRGVNL